MNGTYQYEELRGKNSIRVLIIYKDIDIDAPIRCDLEQVPLDKASDYAALSYSWAMDDGDVSPCRSVMVSGKALCVTRNLFEGLRRIRSSDADFRLWVDAISINQQDVSERNAQVASMGDIYSCANRVIVWLGEGRSELDNAAAFALALYEHDAELGSDGPQMISGDGRAVDIGAVIAWTDNKQPRDEKLKQIQANNYLQQDMVEVGRAVYYLFNMRYWSRRWIVQELFHPKLDSIDLLWGSYRYTNFYTIFRRRSMKFIYTFNHLIETDGAQGKSGMNRSQILLLKDACKLVARANNLLRPRPEGSEGEERRVITLALYLASDQACADDRDRLYAFLSMEPEFGLKADYRLTTTQVYTRFATMLIEKGLFDLVLRNLGHPTTRPFALSGAVPDLIPPLEGLPSWVPDLRRKFEDTDRDYAPLEIKYVNGDILCCELLLVGAVEKVTEYERMFTILQHADTSRIQYKCQAGPSLMMQAGDLVARTLTGFGHTLILRLQDVLSGPDATYKLVQLLPWHRDMETSEKILVRIA